VEMIKNSGTGWQPFSKTLVEKELKAYLYGASFPVELS